MFELIQTDESKFFLSLFIVVFLAAFLGIFCALHFRRSKPNTKKIDQKNVTQLRRANNGKATKTQPKSRRKHLSPLWLVVLAIGLAVGFRSDVWWDFKKQENLVGTVTHVRDGDTIEVAGRAIRLNGLTCDERNTPLGDTATWAMKRLVSGRTLTCKLNGDRTYDREVGRCTLSNGQDIGAFMIENQLCGRCARYDPLRIYASVQRTAGPFQGANPSYCWALW